MQVSSLAIQLQAAQKDASLNAALAKAILMNQGRSGYRLQRAELQRAAPHNLEINDRGDVIVLTILPK